MNKVDIAENLFEAVDVILDQRIKKLKFSQCYLMEVIEETKTLGVYSVKYQGHKYKALGTGYAYHKGDMVWVLAPRNTLDDELTITGIVSLYYKPAEQMIEQGASYLRIGSAGGQRNVSSRKVDSFSIVLGLDSTAGARGFRYSTMEKDTTEDTTTFTCAGNITSDLTIADTCTIFTFSEKQSYGTPIAIIYDSVSNTTKVTFKGTSFEDDTEVDLIADPYKKTIRVDGKPYLGDVDVSLNAIAIGINNKAQGYASFVVGRDNTATTSYAFIEGRENQAGFCAHAEGRGNLAKGDASHAEGGNTKALATNAHAEGRLTQAVQGYAHAEGLQTIAYAQASHAEGGITLAQGPYSHAEGYRNPGEAKRNATTKGSSTRKADATTIKNTQGQAILFQGGAWQQAAHSEGGNTTAYLQYSHAEGLQTIAYGTASHAEGFKTDATGTYSHAEGGETLAVGTRSHAEGHKTWASADCAHAEGASTEATAYAAHAEGGQTVAKHEYSHAGGVGTETGRNRQTVIGQYNAIDSQAMFVVGVGANKNNPANAFVAGNDGTNDYIKIGNTKITESQLLSLLSLI